ncbi:MAG: TIM barrel protein [candidate division KSB1 bacterium]|nr:TIM barrel protein [candidate division KSB1 bacterium]MDZ7346100.1 TIM barrel protein [candidate division KSB1 bacterium]
MSHETDHANDLDRRTVLKGIAATTLVGALGAHAGVDLSAIPEPALKGNLRHSVSKWCYVGKDKWTFEELCAVCVRLGIQSIELLEPRELPTLRDYGLTCAIVSSHSLTKGLNRREHHAECLQKLREAIDAAAAHGCPGTITFPGNREGMDDEEGIRHTVEGLKQIVGYAEKKSVTIHLEFLNSKVDHKDYMFDHMSWGVEVCRRIGSERVKILYDIYHAQIMEGDIIRTIQQYHEYIGHYHTGGVPGRNEIDETQELYYPAIMRAIVAAGYRGFVGQEFVPKRDPLASLAQAIQICDV